MKRNMKLVVLGKTSVNFFENLIGVSCLSWQYLLCMYICYIAVCPV